MSETIGESRFWNELWTNYHVAPSIAFCRVPELEYASQLDVSGRVLDHCCGDGRFASLAWPGKTLTAGCDFDKGSIDLANQRKIYGRTDVADVSVNLPYEDGSFDLVFDNSALEHVKDVDAALREVARVLAPDGTFAFNVLNNRYFEWWPLDENSKKAYRDWQPFYHAWSLQEWRDHLAQARLKVVAVQGYFNTASAQALAQLDCEFSGHFISKRPSKLVQRYQKWPLIFKRYWRKRLENLTWETASDEGAGYFIKAVHANG